MLRDQVIGKTLGSLPCLPPLKYFRSQSILPPGLLYPQTWVVSMISGIVKVCDRAQTPAVFYCLSHPRKPGLRWATWKAWVGLYLKSQKKKKLEKHASQPHPQFFGLVTWWLLHKEGTKGNLGDCPTRGSCISSEMQYSCFVCDGHSLILWKEKRKH
jgi:hypothetical protein